MECKVRLLQYIRTVFLPIGIYPEWNVKVPSCTINIDESLIGIYPEWNVKKAHFYQLRPA